MAGDVSFDVVSDFDEQELRNALDQVRREVQQRFDFKGARVEIEQEKTDITVTVDKLPAQAGIDPVDKLIDRNPDDNVVAVKKR